MIVIAVLVVVKQTVLPYSYLLAGPASTLFAMTVATGLLWRRNASWQSLGFVWPKDWRATIKYTVIAFVGIVVTGLLAKLLADTLITGTNVPGVDTVGRFDFVEGNLLAYLGVMALVWTHSSFFEEMLFRAFLISRGSDSLGPSPFNTLTGSIIVVVLLSLFFGYRHYYYQGLKGALVTGCIGLTLSLMYLWFGKRNLLPLILAHGLVNTISQTQRYLGSGD